VDQPVDARRFSPTDRNVRRFLSQDLSQRRYSRASAAYDRYAPSQTGSSTLVVLDYFFTGVGAVVVSLVHVHTRWIPPSHPWHGIGAQRRPPGRLLAMCVSGRAFLAADCYSALYFHRARWNLLATLDRHILARIGALAALGELFLLVAWSKF